MVVSVSVVVAVVAERDADKEHIVCIDREDTGRRNATAVLILSRSKALERMEVCMVLKWTKDSSNGAPGVLYCEFGRKKD